MGQPSPNLIAICQNCHLLTPLFLSILLFMPIVASAGAVGEYIHGFLKKDIGILMLQQKKSIIQEQVVATSTMMVY